MASHSSTRVHESMPMCSSFNIAILISSADMYSGMSMHDSIVLMMVHMPCISSSLFFSRLFLDSQSAMSSCSPGMYSILMLY